MNNNSSNGKIQVFIISQQSLFKQGIEHTFAGVEDISISGITDVNDSVLKAIDNLPPDVALLDIDGPVETGIELAKKIKQRSPNIGVIVLSSAMDDNQLFMALKAQAVAYLSKEVTADQLVETVRRVAKGEHPINEYLTNRPKVAEHVLQQFQELSARSTGRTSSLTTSSPRTGSLRISTSAKTSSSCMNGSISFWISVW